MSEIPEATGREVFDSLKKQHQEFVVNLRVLGMNQVQAYMKAYPDAKYDTARANSSKLLANANIQAAMQWFVDDAAAALGLSEAYVLGRLKLLAEANLHSLKDESGNLKPMSELTEDELYPIEKLEEKYATVERDMTPEEMALADPDEPMIVKEQVLCERKVTLTGRRGALQDIGRSLKMFTDRVEGNVDGLPVADPAAHAKSMMDKLLADREADGATSDDTTH